jgi:hypothetical protein
MHVYTSNLGMHIHIILLKLYKIDHIYFLLRLILGFNFCFYNK